MVYTLLSWGVIGISAFLWGFGVLFVLGKINHYRDSSIDFVVMTGLCALTVYAQFFSLFYKVGIIALSSVILFDVIWLFLTYKDIINWIKGINRLFLPIQVLLAAGVGLIVLIAASGTIQLYDTYLYHAQAVHWIEEYGVVYGLGNLHSRLAYNSSFFCLQALFSFRYLAGQSLHSMNGFAMWIMLSYAVCSMKFWRNKKIYASDFTRIALIGYYASGVYDASSLGTDVFTLGLIGYIVCKWVTLLEEDEKRIAPYAYLCILGVYAVSVKLSSAMIVLLVIMPAYWLIKEKKWKEIFLYLGLGVLTIAPFLIRNVILSGYLIFPYPELDLFSFDWKIPELQADAERRVIKTWAQGFRGKYELVPFMEWFPVWRDTYLPYDSKLCVELIADIVAIPISLIIGVVKGLQKKNWYFFHLACYLTIAILFWFFSAPDKRFGEIYLMLLPLYLVGNILANVKSRTMAAIVAIVIFVMIGSNAVKHMLTEAVARADQEYLVVCADYDYVSCPMMNIDGLNIYYPNSDESDWMGYYSFPSVPNVYNLSVIELRGKSFSDGFRRKAVE